MKPTDVQPETSPASPGESRLPAFLMALVSLVVSTFSLSFPPRSGASAEFLLAHSGRDLAPTPLYPIWSSLLDLIGRVPTGTLAFRAGLLSVIAGGICVYLTGRILQRVRRHYMAPDEGLLAPLFCAMPGSAYLLLSLPFLMAADRAHPVLIHVAMLLVTIRGIQRFARGGPVLGLVIAAGVAGMATLEWWVMAALAPVLLYYGLKATGKRARDVQAGPVILITAWLAGLACTLALIQTRAWLSVPPGTGPPNLGHTLVSLFTAHQELILAESNSALWICFVLGALIPWALALYCASQLAIESPAEWAILHVIFTGIAGLFLALGAIDVLGASESLASLTLLGVLLSAVTFGYSFAFWYALLDGHLGQQVKGVAGGRFALVIAILLILFICTFRHYPRTDMQTDYILNQWAEAAIRDLPEKTILIGDGPLFAPLVMAAIETGKSIQAIDRSQLGQTSYLNTLKVKLASPNLYHLLLTTPSIAREILLTLPETSTHPVAMLDPLPDGACPWVEIRPLGGFYLAGPAGANPETEAEHNRQIWQALASSMNTAWSTSDLPIRTALRRQTSRLANDLALQFYHDGKADQARSTLTVATQLNPSATVPRVNRALISASHGQATGDDADWVACQNLLFTPRLRDHPLGEYDRDQGSILSLDRFDVFQQGLPPTLSAGPDDNASRNAIIQFLLKDPQALASARDCAQSPAKQQLAGYLISLNGIVAGDPAVISEGMNLIDSSEINPAPVLQGAARWALDHGNSQLARAHVQEALVHDPDAPQTLELATLLDLTNEHLDPKATHDRHLAGEEADNPYAGLYQARNFLEKGYLDVALEELAQIQRPKRIPVIQLIYADLLSRMSQVGEARRSARLALTRSEIDSARYWQRLARVMTEIRERELCAYAQFRANRLDQWNPSPGLDINTLLLERFREILGAVVETTPSPGTVTESAAQRPRPTTAFPVRPVHVLEPLSPRPTPAPPRRPAVSADSTQSFDDEDAKVPLSW